MRTERRRLEVRKSISNKRPIIVARVMADLSRAVSEMLCRLTRMDYFRRRHNLGCHADAHFMTIASCRRGDDI